MKIINPTIFAGASVVTLESQGAIAAGTGQTVTPSSPAGVTPGSLLVLMMAVRDATYPGPSTGWTLVRISANSTDCMWYRIADGGANDNPVITLSQDPAWGWFAQMLRCEGHDPSSPLYVSRYTEPPWTASSISLPSLTAPSDGSLMIGMAGAMGSFTVGHVWDGNWTQCANAYNSAPQRYNLSTAARAVDAGASGGSVVNCQAANSSPRGIQAMFQPA